MREREEDIRKEDGDDEVDKEMRFNFKEDCVQKMRAKKVRLLDRERKRREKEGRKREKKSEKSLSREVCA